MNSVYLYTEYVEGLNQDYAINLLNKLDVIAYDSQDLKLRGEEDVRQLILEDISIALGKSAHDTLEWLDKVDNLSVVDTEEIWDVVDTFDVGVTDAINYMLSQWEKPSDSRPLIFTLLGIDGDMSEVSPVMA